MFDLPRSSGVLLHPTSLPGRFGMGEIGPEAHRWLECLQAMGQSVWQMLPIGPTGYGNSPYQSLSSFAGNPLLISIDSLIMDGLLVREDMDTAPSFPTRHVNFGAALEVRHAYLRVAVRRFLHQYNVSPFLAQAFDFYCAEEASWLDDFAIFMALKEENEQRSWLDWPTELALREPAALAAAEQRLAGPILECKVMQFLFHRQWLRLRSRAQKHNIQLVGDIPIFTAHDSADVWAKPDLFELDSRGHPTVVAGVPPDYFSATGQRWGNPLYRWSMHQADGFQWWIARMRRVFEHFDIVRIDHFRGFAAYWEIPAEEETAVRGQWVEAPGDALFHALHRALGSVPIIAEDLGLITPDVIELRDRHGFPGMRVMQFAFGADSLAEEYVPENYPTDCVAYTGTHDNDTVLGLFHSGPGDGSTRTAEQIEAERRTILEYTKTDGAELNWDFIQHVLQSRAQLAIMPLQDVLGLGTEARMNAPGQLGDWWTWRFEWEQLTPALQSRLLALTQAAQRVPPLT